MLATSCQLYAASWYLYGTGAHDGGLGVSCEAALRSAQAALAPAAANRSGVGFRRSSGIGVACCSARCAVYTSRAVALHAASIGRDGSCPPGDAKAGATVHPCLSICRAVHRQVGGCNWPIANEYFNRLAVKVTG